MDKTIIQTDKAPKAVGPYSQAVRHGSTLYVSGQVPVNPATGKLAEGFENQVRQVLENIKAVVEAAGGDLSRVCRVGVFVTDLGKFPVLNEIYAGYFKDNPPARATVEVSRLPLGAEVEMDAIVGL